MKHWSGIMQSRNEVTGRLIIIMKKSEKMRKVFDEGAPYKTLFQK